MGRNKPQRVGGGGGGRPSSTSGTSTVSKDLRSLDQYLEKQHLQRKPTAKDGSCLFRAVSEQVFLTQFHHEKVRMQCVKYIRDHQEEFQNFVTMPLEEYLTKLTRELWGGEMELVVLSKLYTRTIIVYMYSEQSGTITDKKIHPEERMEATKNPILLAYSDGNHYDSVYSSERMQHIAVCQGILYTMLVERVMKDTIPTVCKKRLESITEHELATMGKRDVGKRDVEKPKPIQLLANHYSTEVVRAMGSQVYHNAELQAHQNERATIERFDRQVATSIQFQVGDKCRFKLPDSQTQDGEISALYSAENCHTVYVYDASEEWVIPSKNIALKHPITGRRNSSQQNQPNRFKNRHGNPRSDDTYNRHDNHPSPKPPSSHPEAWPTPTTTIRVQPTKPPPTNDSKLSAGAAKPIVSSQVQSRQSSDKKGGHDKDKSSSQKVSNPPVATTPASRPKQGTSSVSKMAAPQVPNAKAAAPSKNTTLDNKASSKTPLQGAPIKPPGLNKPAVQQPRPAKVNGGPGGSLTSEDSNYSSSSDESAERGEHANTTSTPPQPPPQSLPARQGTSKPSKQYSGQLDVPPPEWQGGPTYVTGHPNDNEKKAKNVGTTNQRHNFTADKQFQQRARDSPYLVPQIPRDPSSQPEDDWPGFEPPKEVTSPDPASSTLLAAMRSPPRLQTMPPFSVPGPGDPTIVSVPHGTFKQMPLPPTFFGTFNHFPMILSDPPGGHRDIQAPQGYIPATSTPVGYQDRPPVFPSYLVHRTPSGTLINRAPPHGEPQKTMPAPNMRSSQAYPVYSSPAADVNTHREPEPVMPPLPAPVKPDVGTQTSPPPGPVMINTCTQVENDEMEALSMTTYTQTPVKTYNSVAVEASVPTESISVQASTNMASCESQTTSKVAFISELQPPGMEDEPSPDDKIKFAVQYAIQCLEVYAKKDDTDQDIVDILENMKEFEENLLTTCLEQMHSAPKPLDSSQQDFLQSFAGPEFYASQLHQSVMDKGYFNRINPNDNLDQREMMLRQEEMLRQQRNRGPSRESPTGEPSPQLPTEGSSSSLQGKEGNTEHRLSHPGGFPLPPFPMAQYPHPMMQMQRPFMMMPYMPPFFQMPPHQMPPYSMMPPQQLISPNMMDPQSPLSSTPHPPREQESGEPVNSSTPDNEIVSNDDEAVVNHQEYTEESSRSVGTHLVPPSAFTVPPSSVYQQPSTIVSSEVTVQKSDTLKDSKRSSPTNTPEFKKSDSPPPTPFEAKNPYDAVTIKEDNTSAVDNNPPTVPVLNENTEGPSTPVFDESQNLPCRGKAAIQKPSQQQQRLPKTNSQRQRPRQNRSSNKQTTQEPQSDSSKSGRSQERSYTHRRSTKEPTDDVDKGNPRKSNSRQVHQRRATGNRRGADGQATRQQRPANGGASNSSTQPQGGRPRGGGRRQDTSSQVPSNQSERSTGEPTRSASFLDYSEKQHLGIPCTVFQPRAFQGGFPSPNQTEGTEYENEDEYSQPTPAVNERWKFIELSPSDKPPFTLRRDLLNWDRNDAWPKWDAEYTQAGYSETVEDPFPTFPTQDHWDSDVGDMNVSLTVDQDCIVPAQPSTYFDNRMCGTAHAQCVSESKPGKNSSKRSDSECVVQAVKLPK